MQAYKVEKIDKQTKKEPTIRFWDETRKKSTKKIVHLQHSLTDI